MSKQSLKFILSLPMYLLLIFGAMATYAQVTVLDEPFDDEAQFTATPALESAGETADYYRLTDGSDIIPSFVGFSGDFFAAQDTDGVTDAGTTQIVLEWNDLAITGLSNLQLSVVVAEDDSSDGNEDWDANSAVIFEYQIDDGGFQNLLAFEAVAGTNTEPAQDTTFDGLGDGAVLTETPTTFMASIAGEGASLDLRVTIGVLDAGDEDVAFDDVLVTANGMPIIVDPIINEFLANHVTTNENEFIEVLGTASTDYSTYSVLQLEGDNVGDGTARGQIVSVTPIASTDANGLFVTPFMDSVLDNDSMTLLLVELFSGSIGDDLDTDDDGTLDVTPWTRIVDDVAVLDSDAMDQAYSVVILTSSFDNGTDTVPGASRIPNGTDTDTTADWVRNDFDGAGVPALDPGTPELGEAFNTPGAANDVVEESDLPFMCGVPAMPIHDIQGAGVDGLLPNGTVVDIEGVVVGDFNNDVVGELDGFFIQEEDSDADADPLTSEGIFVFAPDTLVDVSMGDVVRVRGEVTEFFNLTQVNLVTNVAICSMRGGATATPAILNLPIVDLLDLESIEGMAVTLPQALTVSNHFDLVSFGEVTLSNGRIIQPTNVVLPGMPANELQAQNSLNQIILDDGRNGSNVMPFVMGRDDTNPLNASNPIRSGHSVTNIVGVMNFTFSNYKVEPTQAFTFDESANPRLVSPPVAPAALTVASFNVLNFFSTIDNSGPICGPSASSGCRGADSASELTRQTDKLVAAITALGADIVGVIEIENNATASLEALIDALNTATAPDTWAFIDSGTIGTDAIKVGLIYTPATVMPMGGFAVLDATVDPRFDTTRNRPALAQAFSDANGEVLNVVVNHYRSKRCSGATGLDADQGDGQACFNETRRMASLAQADWIATDPTGSNDPDYLIIGDLNSYAMEDPIRALTDNPPGPGLVDLAATFAVDDAYSFVFTGQVGALDFAISTPSLATQVLDAVYWNINADEIRAFDYNEEGLSGSVPKPADFFVADAFRASDHDPVVVSLILGPGVVDAENPDTELVVDRTFALADGLEAVNVTIQLVNGMGMPVEGMMVDVMVTGSAVLANSTGVTDVNGQFTTSMTNTTIEEVMVSGRYDINGDNAPETLIINGFPRVVSFEDAEDFIFGDGYE